MKLWITKPWSPWDLGLLKLSALIVGVAVGAFFHEHLEGHLESLLGSALLLGLLPAMHYFRSDR